MKMLLERNDVNPNIADTQYGRTPLWWTARNGHEGIVKMQLERDDVDPNIADTQYGRTPLSWATGNRYEGVVRMLLQPNGINPHKAHILRLNWHEMVVRVLLQRDIDPNIAKAECSRTLSWAAANGMRSL